MQRADRVGRLAEQAVKAFLEGMASTLTVQDVRDRLEFQALGVDLLWIRAGNSEPIRVEVKGDRFYGTGNYFLEEVSNHDKGTVGCFLGTTSDVFAYCYVDAARLFLIPTAQAHAWAVRHFHDFPVGVTDTFDDHTGQLLYHTSGRLVPRKVLAEAMPEIEEHDIRQILERLR